MLASGRGRSRSISTRRTEGRRGSTVQIDLDRHRGEPIGQLERDARGAGGRGPTPTTATATHAAGNASPLSSPYVFTMETTAPGAQTLSDASVVGDCVDAANDTAAQTLGGTAVAGDTVKVYLNGSTTPAFTIADAV